MLIFKDGQVRNASAATKMQKMAFRVAYFVHMNYFEIQRTQRVSPIRVYPYSMGICMHQNLIFHQTVPLRRMLCKCLEGLFDSGRKRPGPV